MKVLQVCAYAAPYEGNFMKSLYALDEKLLQKGHETIYVFPENASNRNWCRDLTKVRKVYFLPLRKARIKLDTYSKLRSIFHSHPDIMIVHSHFELYDLPLVFTTPKHIKLFWHLHDALLSEKKLSRRILDVIQYKLCSSKAILLSVAEKYRNDLVAIGFPDKHAYTVINGIDMARIKKKGNITDEEYDFLSYVWNSYNKGLDILLAACKMLIRDGLKFKILLIGNEQTQEQITEYFPDGVDEIVLQGATTDVNKLYHNAKAFVSSSRLETFSYAVCEAAYAGLPVISSRIAGLEWAENLSSVEFFENENSTMLYQKMKDFLVKRKIDELKIESARKYIEQNFSTDHWVDIICKFYGI